MNETAPPSAKRLPGMRAFRAVLVMLLMAGVGLGIWGMRRYDALVETGKRIEGRFTALDKLIPYEEMPDTGTDPSRIEIMLAARERMLAALPGEILPSIAESGETAGSIELGRDLLRQGAQLEPAAMALADALAEMQMNPREYRRLLLRVVHAAVHNTDDVPVGEVYRQILNRIAPNTDLDYHGLEERQVSAPHEIALARRLETANPMGYLADLVVLTAKEQKTK